MAVLQTLRNFLIPPEPADLQEVVPAPQTVYEIKTLTSDHLNDVLRLNVRCFKNGENYTKHTFSYLLNEPRTLSFRAVTPDDQIVGFVFVMVNDAGAGHLTTIGVAPEHRRRGIGERLLAHTEEALRFRGFATIVLEVRVSNVGAQNLYHKHGYTTVQRIENYYVNGEGCFLMVKSLV
jgi:ribosomal-protein-alanine N-acetyltransferase